MNDAYADDRQPEQVAPEREGRSGQTICVNCNDDDTYDVYAGPLQPASEADYPDGLFGLESIEDALKAVLALKQGGQAFESAGHSAMKQSYNDDTTTRKEL